MNGYILGIIITSLVIIISIYWNAFKIICAIQDSLNAIDRSNNDILSEMRSHKRADISLFNVITKLMERQSEILAKEKEITEIKLPGPGGRVTSKAQNQQRIIEQNKKLMDKKED